MPFPCVMPSPPVAQAGQPPQCGQWAAYVFEDGQETAAIIRYVGDTSPDGKYVNVAAIAIGNQKSTHGGPFEADGWLYEIAIGKIIYVPCGPPFPH
jgi:hypothetical protein